MPRPQAEPNLCCSQDSGADVPLFVFRCPNTGKQVQGFSAEDVSKEAHVYEPVRCIACQYLHHVNPATGAVLDDRIWPSDKPQS